MTPTPDNHILASFWYPHHIHNNDIRNTHTVNTRPARDPPKTRPNSHHLKQKHDQLPALPVLGWKSFNFPLLPRWPCYQCFLIAHHQPFFFPSPSPLSLSWVARHIFLLSVREARYAAGYLPLLSLRPSILSLDIFHVISNLYGFFDATRLVPSQRSKDKYHRHQSFKAVCVSWW